jgi:uncharacterized protein YrrD
MRAGKDFIGKPIISITDGQRIGVVKDLYLDRGQYSVVGVYLGQEKLLSRKAVLVERDQVTVFGMDAILVKSPRSMTNSSQLSDVAKWVRRDRIQGQSVMTEGGTKVGSIDDVLLDENMQIVGYSLMRIQVEGPVAEKRAIAREAILELKGEEEAMIIDLGKAERQALKLK